MSAGAATRALLERAREHGARGDLDAAEAALREALEREPGNAQALSLLGVARLHAGDGERALALLEQAAAQVPASADVQFTLGKVTREVRGAAAALPAFQRAVALAPDAAPAWAELGIARAEAGDLEAAVTALETARAHGAAGAGVHYALGQALQGLDRTEEAIAALERARAASPDDASVLLALATALRRADRVAEAHAHLERALDLEPGNAELHLALGRALHDLARPDAALERYRHAVALEPQLLAAHEALNRLLWERGEHAAYLESYAAAVRRAPASRELRLERARWLNLAGRHEEAEGELREAIGLGGAGDPELHRLLARSLANRGRTHEALEHLEQAAARAPRDPRARLDLARMLLVLGEPGAARAHVDAALAAAPDDQEAIAYLGLCWRLAGDPREGWLNDHARLVRSYRVPAPPGHAEAAAFNRALDRALNPLHRGRVHPPDQTLRGGTQTHGALFDRRIDEVQQVRRGIERCVRAYVEEMAGDPEHPLLRRRAAGFRFAASWSCRLRRSGFHTNHVHPKGWISSCYYVALPDEVARGDGREGWLTFGETNLGLGDAERVAHAVRPEEGLLVLFPSYFFHGTVPFESDQARTTIAFDVVPV